MSSVAVGGRALRPDARAGTGRGRPRGPRAPRGDAGRRGAGRLLSPLLLGLAFVLCIGLAAAVERWRVAHRLARLVVAETNELDRQLLQLAIVPRLLADDPRVVAALAPSATRARATANALLERAAADSGAAAVFVMDAGGETIASSNHRETPSFVGANYAFRPYFRGAVEGRESTYFAVGATTGVPGYFIARAVRGGPIGDGDATADAAVIGVVVAKVSLDALVASWRGQEHRTLVTDELGVVILSGDPALLYAASAPLDAPARRDLARERRYVVREDAALALWRAAPRARLDGRAQLRVSRALGGESWTLHLLVAERRLFARSVPLGLAVAALLAVAVLLARLFREQRRLAESEQRVARELEREVRRRTAELEAAQRALIAESNFAMLGRLSAAINHEINQPLASLRLDLATLRALAARRPPPLEEMRGTVADVERTTRRIARVVETLRNVARRGRGRLAPLDARRLVDESVATLRRERPDAAAALRVSGNDASGAGPLAIDGDAVLLQQALLNLSHNALDAVRSRERPRVTLALVADGADGVAFVVGDNGPGVDPALAERLFEPFASARAGGLGLGLAIARQIAEDHGGTLRHRAGAGGGAEFVLRLPRSDGGRAAADDDG